MFRSVTLFASMLMATAVPLTAQAQATQAYDVILRGGTMYDGTGAPGRIADVGIRGDRIAAIGDLRNAPGKTVLEAKGLAVAPGFINMLSWSTDSLIADGRSQGEIRQGVTLEVMGEGNSMGPLTDEMKRRAVEQQGDIRYDITWTTLAEYLAFLEKKGISPNVASYIGAATIREHVVGLDDRQATAAELEKMRALVRREMQAGALGIGSSLIYAPGTYASTEELIELSKAAAPYGGRYISHLRSEGDRFLEAVDELITIARAANVAAEIYHLKAAGASNWPKMDQAIAKIETARKEGLRITADMYTYTAGSTGFDACIPPWSRAGGYDALFKRIADPATRARMIAEMRAPAVGWENLCQAAGTPQGLLLVEFKNDALKPLTGKRLDEVMKIRGTDAENTILDLIAEDRTRVGVVFFLMSEDNVRKQVQLPWVSLGSDASSMAPEGVFLKSSTHPRAYGNFARFLGRYVRDEKLVPLPEAIRRLTSLPAANLGLADRGTLKVGAFADVVAFDPATIADKATFEQPHQYAVGMRHVLVNGVPVLREGEHTGATPGRALKGSGARGAAAIR
jgi:N-acyl-D-aspartate/D-glutamate deacylase